MRNEASRGNSFVGAGTDNQALSNAAVMGGTSNKANGGDSFVGGGTGNSAQSPSSAVVGGTGNTATESNAAVVTGTTNAAGGRNAAVVAGNSNQANGASSVILGGESNIASGENSVIGAGFNNTASGHNSAILGGRSNIASAESGTVVGTQGVAWQKGQVVISAVREQVARQGSQYDAAWCYGEGGEDTVTTCAPNGVWLNGVNLIPELNYLQQQITELQLQLAYLKAVAGPVQGSCFRRCGTIGTGREHAVVYVRSMNYPDAFSSVHASIESALKTVSGPRTAKAEERQMSFFPSFYAPLGSFLGTNNNPYGMFFNQPMYGAPMYGAPMYGPLAAPVFLPPILLPAPPPPPPPPPILTPPAGEVACSCDYACVTFFDCCTDAEAQCWA